MNHRTRCVRCTFVLLTTAILICAAGSVQAQKQFRWNLSSGDRFQIDVSQQVSQTVMIAEETIEIPSKIQMMMDWRVTDVAEDGTAEVVQTVNQVVIDMTVPGISENVKYDSSLKDEPTGAAMQLAEVIQPMIGVRFTQKMDPLGRILEVDVPKDAFKGLESNQILKQFFSGEAFKQLIAKASPVFPDEAIQNGHVWQSKATQSTPLGTTTLDSRFTYDGEQQKDDKTLDKFSVALTMGIDSSRVRGTKIQITQQDNKGTLLFDLAGGFLAESTLNQSVSMKVTSGDTVVNQTITNVMTMTVTKE